MKLPPIGHRWRLTPRRAIALQKEMAGRVCVCEPRGPLRYVAGLDAAFSPGGDFCLAAVVLWDAEDRCVIEQHVAWRPLHFAYIPGLLSFREAPALLAALRKLKQRPDVVMCDGQGMAHPRRFGIACHVGVLCELPAVGCAKSRLVGTHREPGRRRGAFAPLEHQGEIIGGVLRTQDNVRPVFVSVGHQMDLASARRLVLRCAIRYRLPEPTRLADQLVGRAKREARFTTGDAS